MDGGAWWSTPHRQGFPSALRALDCDGLLRLNRDQVGGALRSAEDSANLNLGGACCVSSRRCWFSLVRRLRSAGRRSGSAPRSTAARRRNRVRGLPLRGRRPCGALCPFPGSRAPPVPRRLGRLWPLGGPRPQSGYGRVRPCPCCVLGRPLSRHGVHDRRGPGSRSAGGRSALLSADRQLLAVGHRKQIGPPAVPAAFAVVVASSAKVCRRIWRAGIFQDPKATTQQCIYPTQITAPLCRFSFGSSFHVADAWRLAVASPGSITRSRP